MAEKSGADSAPSGNPAGNPDASPGRGYLAASAVFAVVFIGNLVYGKIAISQGATTTPGLGDVGEFLVLFVTVALFIAACVSREKAKAHVSTQ